MTEKEFLTYWKYYHRIEDDFQSTERYVAFDEKNYGTFSTEYMKIMQSACSEVEVTLHKLLDLLHIKPEKDTISYYYLALQPVLPSFFSEQVTVNFLNEPIKPWEDIKFTLVKNKDNDKYHPEGSAPFWWDAHNDIKHHRDEKSTDGWYNYERANLKNALYSMAALFQIEFYIYEIITNRKYGRIIEAPSAIFDIIREKRVVLGTDMIGFPTGDDEEK